VASIREGDLIEQIEYILKLASYGAAVTVALLASLGLKTWRKSIRLAALQREAFYLVEAISRFENAVFRYNHECIQKAMFLQVLIWPRYNPDDIFNEIVEWRTNLHKEAAELKEKLEEMASKATMIEATGILGDDIPRQFREFLSGVGIMIFSGEKIVDSLYQITSNARNNGVVYDADEMNKVIINVLHTACTSVNIHSDPRKGGSIGGLMGYSREHPKQIRDAIGNLIKKEFDGLEEDLTRTPRIPY